MDFTTSFWGVNNTISLLEVSLRALAMFFFLLMLVRIFGMRPFGKTESFDVIIVILLGSVAARGIIGASPFLSAVAACTVLVLIHSLLANVSFFSRSIGKRLKGEPLLLYSDGKFNTTNMRKVTITEHDIYEELRFSLHTNSMENILQIYFERDGRISFIGKNGDT